MPPACFPTSTTEHSPCFCLTPVHHSLYLRSKVPLQIRGHHPHTAFGPIQAALGASPQALLSIAASASNHRSTVKCPVICSWGCDHLHISYCTLLGWEPLLVHLYIPTALHTVGHTVTHHHTVSCHQANPRVLTLHAHSVPSPQI